MKKKILCLAAAIVMTMTSTAFAADTLQGTPRGTGDVTQEDATDADAPGLADGTGKGLTAYDAAVIQYYYKTGIDLTSGKVLSEGNYNGKTINGSEVDANDSQLVLDVVKDPKLETNNKLGLSTPTRAFEFNFDKKKQLPTTTLKDSLDMFLADNKGGITQAMDQLNAAINRISFNSATMGSVKITTENGWDVFLTQIQPLLDLNGTATTKNQYGYVSGGTGVSYENMDKIKALIVKEGGASLSYDDLVNIVAYAEAAIPGASITDEALKATAANVQKVTETKFKVSAVTPKDFTGKGTATTYDGEAAYSATVTDFVDALCTNKLYNYESTTLQQVIDAMGTWAAAHKESTAGGREQNVKVEIYETANYKLF